MTDHFESTNLVLTLTPGGMFDLEVENTDIHLLLSPGKAFKLALSFLQAIEENTSFEELGNV